MKVLLFFLLLVPVCGFAQKKDTILKYINRNLEFTTQKEAAFFGVAVKRTDSWFLYAIYPDSSALLKAYYKDRELRIKEGPYSVYYPKKGLAQQGHYHDNKRTGIWRFWYENGQMKDSGTFDNDLLVGQWKSWYPNGQLKSAVTFKNNLTEAEQKYLQYTSLTGQPLLTGLRHGAYSTWYEDGKQESKGFYTNHLIDGEWQWYHANGALSTIETYLGSKLTSLKCFDSTGKETGDFCPIAKPAVLKRYGDYKTFIQENLTWPAEALKNKIEGEVRVRFKITKEGKIENLEIQSHFPILAQAVEDLFATMTDWYPAVSHNRIIESEEEYIIPFIQMR